jgi:hypothetical protein
MIRLKQNSLSGDALGVPLAALRRRFARSTMLFLRSGQGGIEKETVRDE